jgi:hypothetical protein
MKLSNLKLVLLTAFAVMALSSNLCSAKGTVTGKAYLDPSAPKECNFKEKQDTQQGCSHEMCNAAVKNAIAQIQRAQPNDKCKLKATSRGCEYWNCS